MGRIEGNEEHRVALVKVDVQNIIFSFLIGMIRKINMLIK